MCGNFNLWSLKPFVLLVWLSVSSYLGSAQVPRDQLFPFGSSNGDSTLRACNVCNSGAITLKYPFTFFNSSYNQLYVNNVGVIAFNKADIHYKHPCPSDAKNGYGALIASFWSYVDTTKGGQVHYRESTDTTLISRAVRELKTFPEVKRLSMKSIFIATWDKVGHHHHPNCQDDKLMNTFQVVLTTDGLMSFVLFYYTELNWSSSLTDITTCIPNPQYIASAGFTAGVGHPFHEVFGKCGVPPFQLANNSNVGETGKWIFRVDRYFEEPCEYIESNTFDMIPGRVFLDSMSGSQIITLVVSPCRMDRITNATCVFKFGSQESIVEKPAVLDKLQSITYCQLPYTDTYGKLEVELKFYNAYGGKTEVNSTTAYVVEPKIDVQIKFEEINSTALPIMQLEWNQNIFSPNVTTLDVIGLEALDNKTIKEIKLFSAIPNSGKFSRSIDLSPVISSVLVIRLSPTDGVVGIKENNNLYKDAGISRPFCSEVVHYADFRSKEDEATERCEEWYETVPGLSTEGVESCPPKLIQAIRDYRFSNDMDGGDFYDEKSFHPNVTHFFRQTNPSPKTGARQKCVYDKSGNLIHTTLSRGTTDVSSGTISHWYNDLQPYCDCCHSSDNCDKYFEKRPSDNGENYKAPFYASVVGNGHIVTFDGLTYMFNGEGEFWLIKSTRFWMQVRMESLASKRASISTAFVMDDGVTRIQVEVKEDGTPGIIVILDGHIVPFPHNSHERLITKSATIVKEISGRTTIVFSSGFTFAFENVRVTVGIQSLNLIASSSSLNLGKLSGLFGQFDENSENDLLTPNGTIILSNSNTLRIHYDFGLPWMTIPEDSAFAYSKSQTNWTTYNHKDFKPWFKLSTFRRSTPPNVAIACGNSSQCLFDWAATGEVDFAKKTREDIDFFKETVEAMAEKSEVVMDKSTRTAENTSAVESNEHCKDGQVEINGIIYVKEGCPLHFICTTNTSLVNPSDYKRILWTKDDLFLFGIYTKYRRNLWAWHTFPAPGVKFSVVDSNVWSIVLLDVVEYTTGKYKCEAQPENSLTTETITSYHTVIVPGKDEAFPPEDALKINTVVN